MIKPERLEYENLPARLAEEVPELRVPYEEYLQWWGGEEPGSHNVYGDLLNPYLISLLSTDVDPKTLVPVFRLMEDLAAHDDHRVREVAAYTVIERLFGEGLLGSAWPHMGEAMRSLALEVLTHYFRSDETVPVDQKTYQRRWQEEIVRLGGMENLTVEAVLSIRDSIYDEFGIKRHKRV